MAWPPSSYGYQWQRCDTYQSAALSDSPIGFWRLGDTLGTSAADLGSAQNAGTYAGGVSLGQQGALAGDPDGAARLDGSSGYVQLPSTFPQFDGGAFTIEAWFKTSSTAWQPIFTRGTIGSYPVVSLWIAGGAVSFYGLGTSGGSDSAASTASYADGSWHHAVAVRQASSLTLYIEAVRFRALRAPRTPTTTRQESRR